MKKKKISQTYDRLSSDNNGNSADYKLITISLGGGGTNQLYEKRTKIIWYRSLHL